MSCSCDGDAPSAWTSKTRRSRVLRLCCECSGFIEIGETYQYDSGVWDGQGASFHTCEQCAALRTEVHRLTGCTPCLTHLAHEVEGELRARFQDIRIRRRAAICPIFHAEANQLPA